MTRRSLFKTTLTLFAALFTASANKTSRSLHIVARRCTGCKECWYLCPVGAVEMVRGKAVIELDTCTGCRLCHSVCSYGAVEQCEKEQEKKNQADGYGGLEGYY